MRYYFYGFFIYLVVNKKYIKLRNPSISKKMFNIINTYS